MSGHGPQLRLRGGRRSKQLRVPGCGGRPLELGSGEGQGGESDDFSQGERERREISRHSLAPGKGGNLCPRGQNGTATSLHRAADIGRDIGTSQGDADGDEIIFKEEGIRIKKGWQHTHLDGMARVSGGSSQRHGGVVPRKHDRHRLALVVVVDRSRARALARGSQREAPPPEVGRENWLAAHGELLLLLELE